MTPPRPRCRAKTAPGSYTQIVYGPGGDKLALHERAIARQGLRSAKAEAQPLSTPAPASDHYRHSDWLGSNRLFSTPSRTGPMEGGRVPLPGAKCMPLIPRASADPSFTGQNFRHFPPPVNTISSIASTARKGPLANSRPPAGPCRR